MALGPARATFTGEQRPEEEHRHDEHPQEFPRHDERRTGRRHRYGYAVGMVGAGFGDEVLKHDLVAGTSQSRRLGPGREAGDHPSDNHWVNRMLRWFLARPVLLTVVAVLGIAVVFTALLVVGPPGGREA